MAPRVVSVSSVDPQQSRVALGTGLALDARHVVAHAHLYTPGDRVTVALRGGERLEAELVAADPLYLLALWRVMGSMGLEAPELTAQEDLRPGLLVAALGYPFPSEFSVSLGVIGTPDRTIYRPERFPVDGLVVTDATVHLGNVGGPLIDLEGRWVGVNTTPVANGLSLCIQAGVVKRLVGQILEHGRATHPWLGFSGQAEAVPLALAQLLQIPVQRGISVTHVEAEGPGERAGVRPLDLVVAIDGRPVASLGATRRALAELRPGESRPLTVLRGGDLRELEMPVEEMPRLESTPWTDPQS